MASSQSKTDTVFLTPAMVRVLVLGASGYIGRAAAVALRRSSHTMYGLARATAKGQQLARHESIPMIGSVEGGEYLETITSANIDVVIDFSAVCDASWKILEPLKRTGAERLKARGGLSPKLGFVYTPGVWIYGTSSKHRLSRSKPC